MKKYNLLIILLLFLIIYEPPIININILHIIGIISCIYIIFKGKIVSNAIKIQKVYKIYFIFILIWIYLVIIALINNNSILQTCSFLYWMFDILPACIMICTYLTHKKYSIYDFFNNILIAGTLQGIIALGAFLIPSIQVFFIKRFISYGYGDVYRTLSSIRMYGFASNLTYTTPIVQSILAILSIYLAINKNWVYIFFTPLLFFSAIINARTSIPISIIGLLVIMICGEKLKIKSFCKTAIIIAILIIVTKFSSSFIEIYAPNTYNWIFNGINEISNFLKGNISNGYYFSEISNPARYILPNNFGILFGVGQRIMANNSYGVNSDIGFINDIWLGGFFYCAILYLIFIGFLFSIIKTKNKQLQINKFLFLLLSATFIVANIKGYIFNYNNFTTLFFLMYSFIVLRKEKIQ